jgi:hypothetical protein
MKCIMTPIGTEYHPISSLNNVFSFVDTVLPDEDSFSNPSHPTIFESPPASPDSINQGGGECSPSWTFHENYEYGQEVFACELDEVTETPCNTPVNVINEEFLAEPSVDYGNLFEEIEGFDFSPMSTSAIVDGDLNERESISFGQLINSITSIPSNCGDEMEADTVSIDTAERGYFTTGGEYDTATAESSDIAESQEIVSGEESGAAKEESEDEVEYLGAWTGTFRVNNPGVGKSMIRLQAAMESEETGSETAYESDNDTVPRPSSPCQEDHFQPLSPFDPPPAETESSDEEDEQEPLSPQCSSPTPGQNHRAYCCVERCALAKRFIRKCKKNKVKNSILQREIGRVRERLLEEQNFNSNLFMLALNISDRLANLGQLMGLPPGHHVLQSRPVQEIETFQDPRAFLRLFKNGVEPFSRKYFAEANTSGGVNPSNLSKSTFAKGMTQDLITLMCA